MVESIVSIHEIKSGKKPDYKEKYQGIGEGEKKSGQDVLLDRGYRSSGLLQVFGRVFLEEVYAKTD